MQIYSGFAALLLSFAMQSVNNAPQMLISGTVTFPKSGPISIEGIVKQGE
jgi:hypothetical protein